MVSMTSVSEKAYKGKERLGAGRHYRKQNSILLPDPPELLVAVTILQWNKPPNKGHVGDNINSAVLSFVERLSSFAGCPKCIRAIGRTIFGTCPL